MRYWRLAAAAAMALMVMPSRALAQNPQRDVASRLRPYAAEWERLVTAEDARAATSSQLIVLLNATRSPQPELRRLAVRALGRLERSSLTDSIARLLRDPAPAVRAEAAHALGQANVRDSLAVITPILLSALENERHPAVIAAVTETIGRARHRDAASARLALEALTSRWRQDQVARLGVVRGLFFLARQSPARPLFSEARAELLDIAVTALAPTLGTRTRTIAAATLGQAGLFDAAAIGRVLSDPDPLVRREAAVALVTLADTAAGRPLVLRALADTSGMVRFDALRAYGRRYAQASGCAPVRAATTDRSIHVALQAIDLLATACSAEAASRALLDSHAAALQPGTARWHSAGHALVGLARVAPERARARLPAFATHASLFVRTYAATAAGIARDTALLLRLARDAQPNVRTAAVEGLMATLQHHADSVYIAQLRLDDSQLLMAAATALEGSTDPRAAAALLDALDRVSALRSETSRDGRVALLQRVRELGSAALAPRMRAYLRDFDPLVAALAADILSAWTGSRVVAEPAAPLRVARPTFTQAAELASARVLIELLDGGTIELRLLPFDAPTNAWRFARLARGGYFNGLTLHRIAPNFVVQGGSPNANEYAGDKPFTRDELAAFNWRATVGLSTRGRDTGDGQLYINLIDNVRLDHDYTVFAEVVRGMDVVDRMLEGVVLRRVTITTN